MMDTGGVQPGYVVRVILLCLCLSKDASTLVPGANHVQTNVYYTQQAYTVWIVYTQYRSVRNERYICESGWYSSDDIACDYAICNGKTNLNGACKEYYSNSHIIYAGGKVQNNADGFCLNPDSCTCAKTGFYSNSGSCGMCTAINHCNIETCTNSADQTCQECEGVGQERAYVVSSDRRACNLPAVTDPARVFPVRAQGGWMLHGSVNITRVYSSLGRYVCRWYQRTGSGPDNVLSGVTLDLYPDPTNSTNTAERAGSCSWSGVMPNDTGTYTYRVVVSPPTNATTGAEVDLAIARPLAPVASCIPSAYVLENTTINCTCSTENIGEPAGRLVWYRNSNVLSYGNYSDVKLDMPPQTPKLSDHGVTQFRCDVEWAVDIVGKVITAKVGYAPTATDLNIPSIASENQAVTIDCHADGRPTPNMTLVRQDKNVVVRTGPSPLSYTIRSAQCEDNAEYVCTAGNGMGPDQEDTASLIVKCKPHIDSIETIPLPDVIVKLNNQPVTFSFDVTAYPVPDNFTFTFVRPNFNVKASVSLSQDIAMNAACVAQSGSLYRAACSVTVPAVRSEDKVGVYRLRMANSQGYQDYAFQIQTEQTGEQSGSSSAESAVFAAIGLGVALAIVLVTIIIIALWLWRRDWTLPCSGTSKGEGSDHRLSARDASVKEEHQSRASYSNPAEQTCQYDSLQMQDVELRSPYAEISYHGDR